MPAVKGEVTFKGPAPAVAKTPAKTSPPPKTPLRGPVIKTTTEPVPKVAPVVDGPPVPALLQHGFPGGIDKFNARVQTVHDSYTKAYGVPPSPGLVFDLAKSPVDESQFAHMFTVPQNPMAAASRAIAIAHGYDPNGPLVPDAKHVANQITEAALQGNYHNYVTDNADTIHSLIVDNKKDAAIITGAIFKARRYEAQHELDLKVAKGEISSSAASEQLQSMGFISPQATGKVFGGILGTLNTAAFQIGDSLVHSPAGVYEVGKAIGLDTRDYLNTYGQANSHKAPFTRTAGVARAMGKGYERDIEHPGQNPGYLFLDALGMLTVAGGAAAKVGEAGRLVSAGDVGGAAKSLVTRAPLKRVELNHGGFTEEMPLSQNPVVAAAQKFVIDRRAARAQKAIDNPQVPSGLTSILTPQIARDLIDENLSFARKLGREADARKRVDHIVQMTLSRELDHVAGRSIMQSRVLAKTPSKLRGSLTRGEQKAIQVMSWDDPDPLTAERDFHQRMIDMGIGDPKAHQRQIADLKLAQKVLENPSPRFRKALALTRQVVSEMEQIKIKELGLLPETAEGRVAKAGAVLRSGEDGGPVGVGRSPAVIQGEINKLQGLLQAKHADDAAQARVAPYAAGGVAKKIAKLQSELAEAKQTLVPAERTTDESFYLPTQRRGKVKRQSSDRAGYYPTKAGPYGIPLGRNLPELTHEFTGKALEAGDIRIDATSLATEAYARTVRAATVRAEHSKLWDAATDTPRSRFDVPIRDSNDIPDKLREVIARIDEGDFGPTDAELLPTDMRDLIQELYPDPRKLTKEQIDGVKWVDGRLLGEGAKMPHIPGLGAAVAQAINAPIRFTMLYLRPAYILNKLGNHAMLWLDQDIHTPVTFAKAMSADSRYGAENARTIRSLVGAGKSESYVTSSSGRISHAVADFWARVADCDERVASFIYYMERKGYKSREQVDALLHDPEKRADLTEITRRGNKALVEFDNLTPIEKNNLRHFIFVYPWVSRSAVWSLRTILDHPVKIDLLAQMGRHDEETDPIFKAAPDWFKRIGYIPLGWNHDGTPRVINPTSVNTFSTIGDFLALGRAVVQGDKYASAGDFLGPAPSYFIHAATGRDEFGNQYPGSQWLDAAKEVLAGLPQVAAYEKAGKTKTGSGKQMALGDRSSLLSAFNANMKKTVMSPGWLDGYGSLIAGGLTPKNVNLTALAARYWRDQDPQKRHEHELDFLNRALDIQGQALGAKVPKNVRAAVADQSNIDFAYKKFLKESGRAPTDKERAGFTIDYLKDQGLITPAKAAQFHKTLKPLADPSDISLLKGMILDKYAGGVALRQWDTDVRQISSLTPAIFNQKASELYAQGLASQRKYNVSQDSLYDYGRKFVKFTHEAAELQKQIKEGTKTDADLRAFQDANDKPVNGLPSFIRFAWAQTPKAQQQQKIVSATTASWGSLTAFDKSLLGRPSDAKVTEGWAKLKSIVDDQRTQLKRQGRSFPSGYERTLAKYVEKYYDAPGLVKDYDFSKEPTAERLKRLSPILKSPHADLWNQLLGAASVYHKYLAQTDAKGHHTYNLTQVRQSWADYVNSQAFQSWLDSNPSFKTEVDAYGKTLLPSLVS